LATVTTLLLAGTIVAADRVTKEIAVRRLAFGRHRFVRVVLTRRPIFARDTSLRTMVALWVAAAACAVGALLYAPALHHNALVTTGIAVALAGALGNLGDRVIRGAVVDFVSVGWWPVFNLADVAIVAGAAVAGASLLPLIAGR
jgi:signal peptidase II